MRNELIKRLSEKLEKDNDVVFLYGDLGWPILEPLKAKFNDRVINAGISEQAMIGIAAGLSRGGKKPYCYTMCAFMLYRAFEFIRDDLIFNKNKAVIVSVGSGFQDYPREGATHNAIEDIAIGTAIPNLTILSPSDGRETEILMDNIDEIHSAIWFRITKSSDYEIHDKHKYLKIGEPLVLKDGSDLTIISTGQITKSALEVAKMLEADNINARVVECPTLKPLDLSKVLQVINEDRKHLVVVIEESTGGLTNIVCKAIVDKRLAIELISCSIPESFNYKFGNKEWMLKQAGLDAYTMYQKITNRLKSI